MCIVNHVRDEHFKRSINMHLHFQAFWLALLWHRQLKSLLMEEKNIYPILRRQLYDWWCLCDGRIPDNDNHGIGLVFLHYCVLKIRSFNTSRLRQNGRHFTDDISICIFWNENVWMSITSSFKFVPRSPIDTTPALVQIMAWCRPAKPLSEPIMVKLPTHICVTRPQWVKVVQMFYTKVGWPIGHNTLYMLCAEVSI